MPAPGEEPLDDAALAALRGELDALYARRPGDFTALRDERARQLRADLPAVAARVRRLKRPTAAAWLVNQLVRHETDQLDELLGVGEGLRAAQDSLDAAALREMTRLRRRATAALTTRARSLARELGEPVSAAVATQVEGTLTAALLDADAAAAVRSGALTGAIEPGGLGATASGAEEGAPERVVAALAAPEAIGMVASPRVHGADDGSAGSAGETDGPRLRVVASREEQAEARRRRDAARREVAEAERAHADAESRLERLREREERAADRIAELTRQLGELEARAERLADEAEAAEGDVAGAGHALDAARERRERADAAYERVHERD